MFNIDRYWYWVSGYGYWVLAHLNFCCGKGVFPGKFKSSTFIARFLDTPDFSIVAIGKFELDHYCDDGSR